MRFRTTLLDTVRVIGKVSPRTSPSRVLPDKATTTDALAHLIIPRHPALRPHARMLHHFRFILPLLPRDEDGLTPLHYYDSAVQLARHASREPTESEFIVGMNAAAEIRRM